MNNEERDKKIGATHDAVLTLVATDKERQKQCAAHSEQIKTLFAGFNQTEKNTTSIRAIATVSIALWGTATSICGWVIRSIIQRDI